MVSVTRPDFDADAYVGQLWRVPLDGGEPVRVTRGFRDTDPRFTPDGRLLGFLRAQPGKPPQLAIVPADGGEPMVVTDVHLGVCDFAFSDDGTRLAFTARVPEHGRYGTVEGVDARAEDPRLVTTLQFRINGSGYLGDQRQQLFVLDVPDPRAEPPVTPVGRAAEGRDFVAIAPARQLSSGDFDHEHPVWDGDAVVVVSSRHGSRDTDLRADLYRFSLDGGEPERLTDSATGDAVIGSPVVAGEHIYFIGNFLGTDGLSFFGQNPGVFAVPRSGGPARRLTDAETVHASDLVADGNGVLGIDLVRGSGVALRVDTTGERQRWEVPGSVMALGAAGGVRVAVLADGGSQGEVVLLDRPDAAVTDFAAALRAADAPLAAQELEARSADGYPVHGWVVRPAGDGPHPVLLVIHGGPFAAYGPSFFDEAQVYAGAGYAVVMCNPRGSAGYGQEHARAIQGGFGDRDSVDVLAFLDHALATVPGLDAGRVGVMGGSYGGYLTAWLIAHEHRFAGAIVERGYLDPPSFIGSADIGWYFPQACHGSPEAMLAQSPLALVDQVRTPTLVLHSEQDLRCPIATAERYYTELKLNGVETELLVFPGENHELSRSGTPHHRRARFEHILRWWDRYLPVG
jgi:dipeptidyl aminopeptidase/acylaminoacyl peptidase